MHTPGPLQLNPDGLTLAGSFGGQAVNLVANCDVRHRTAEENRANARRLMLCWNACVSLSDDELEAEQLGPVDVPHAFPTIVCLCGSTRFADAYVAAQRAETLAGRIVLSVGLFGHGEALDMQGGGKAMLDRLHLRKIDLADEVLVLDCAVPWCDTCQEFRMLNTGCSRGCAFTGTLKPYVGESTRREIAHAETAGKRVRYLSLESKGNGRQAQGP